jgi:hypothetical protein
MIPSTSSGPHRSSNLFECERRRVHDAGTSGHTGTDRSGWLLAQGDDIALIPGTKRVARVEEKTAADHIGLSAEQIKRLNNLTPAAGERHDEGNMAVIDR